MEKYTVFVKSCRYLTKYLFVLFDATAVCDLLSFPEKSEKTFSQFDFQKKLCQTHRKFTATFIEKIYRR